MTLQYRKAELQDLNEINALIEAAIEGMCQNGIFQWDDLYPTMNDFENDILQGTLYVAFISNKIAAVYAVNEEYDEQYQNGKWIFNGSSFKVIHRFCVHPHSQNKGVAKKVLEHIERTVTSENVKSIRLDVFSQNSYAVKLYEKSGYIKVGEANWRKGLFYLMEKPMK